MRFTRRTLTAFYAVLIHSLLVHAAHGSSVRTVTQTKVNTQTKLTSTKQEEDDKESDSSNNNNNRAHLIGTGIRKGWIWATSLGKTASADSIRPAPVHTRIALVGMAYTGTASLTHALEMLGYAPLQLEQHVLQGEMTTHVHAFQTNYLSTAEYVRGLEDAGFDTIFAYNERFIDWVADRAKEAVENHQEPNNKDDDFRVILTVCEDDRAWARSWVMVAEMMHLVSTHPVFSWRSSTHTFLPVLHGMAHFHQDPAAEPEDYKSLSTAQAAYLRHIQNMKRVIPAEKLLIYNVHQGWKPLCQFLNKPIPEGIPFPQDSAIQESELVLRTSLTTLWVMVYVWRTMVWMGVIMTALQVYKCLKGSKGKRA